MSASVDALVEKTYRLLLSVVHTTAVSKRVLQRPPFTFLHKLLVETLEKHGIFSAQQLVFCELVTKEDKAAFLTRALAFVSFAMANLKEKTIPVLLLVSPVKVLAGVSIENTLEFLGQLCLVCNSTDNEAKESAAREVLAKGDAQLYTTGVTFRRGLVLIQAIVRTFISRRVGKRRQSGAVLNAPLSVPRAGQSQRGFYVPSAPQSMEIGTKFLKELSNGRVYDGVIVAVRGKRYTLRYEQDTEAEDDVDEIEMKILLEESVRLHKLREQIQSPQKSRRQDDVDLSLTSLPDLTPEESSRRPRLSKHYSSSRAIISQVSSVAIPPPLMRSMSTRHSGGSVSVSTANLEQIKPTDQPSPQSSRRSKLEAVGNQHSDGDDISRFNPDVAQEPADEKPWQASLKKILATGQPNVNSEAHAQLTQRTKRARRETTVDNRTPRNNVMPEFPPLMIPGKRKLPAVQKRKQPTAGFTPPGAGVKPQPKAKPSNDDQEATAWIKPVESSCSNASHHNSEFSRLATAGAARLPAMSAVGDIVVDKAFGGAYQSTDQKTQEKLALFREIVHRIDGYMKRKHLRVIDLFRFCDADGNGSISPQEMIDTLSQMEIQLSPEQAHEFINYIDKDGNGSIDIDEFEELLRVARRNEVQREQLKKELQHGKKSGGGGAGDHEKSTGNRFAALIKNRHRILDELKSLDIGDVGAVGGLQAKSTILRLQLVGVDEAVVNELLDRSRAHMSVPDDSPSSSPAPLSLTSPSVDPSAANAATADTTVYLHHIAKALNDFELSKKANRFLDQSWLAQFDSQLERAFRDFELL